MAHDSQYGGGPRTAEGKRVSSANAIKHGMTARRHLPRVLQPGRVESYRSQLCEEYAPSTPVEDLLVNEMARHAAMLELSEQAEGAVLRCGALDLCSLISQDGRNAPEDDDSLLSAAVATEALDRFARYRRGHEKAFYAALNKLRELRATRNRKRTSVAIGPVDDRFPSEHDCEAHLRKRFEVDRWCCPRCGAAAGHWIPSRCCWECAHCKRQTGLRTGTVMERSPLPLTMWFRVIQHLMTNPETSATELSQQIGVRRLATVRRMMRKTRDALESDAAGDRLAGLDEYCGNLRPT